MKKTFKIIIDPSVSEQDIIEGCLNLKASGYDSLPIFGLYALGKSMNLNDFIYYAKLIEEVK